MRFIGDPPEMVRTGLEHVFERAVASGLPEPRVIAVDDADQRWLTAISAVPPNERQGAVLVASCDASLVLGARLGVGGAVWQPCSSIAALEALEAAAQAAGRPISAPDGSLADLADETVDHTELTIADHRFWLEQLGRREVERLLRALAEALDVPPVLLHKPSLWIAAGPDRKAAAEAWRGLNDASGAPSPALVRFTSQADGSRAAERVAEGGNGPFPVRELPSGRQVGGWSLGPTTDSESYWSAWPEDPANAVTRWVIDGSGTRGPVLSVRSTDEVETASDCQAVRAPGWLGSNLRPGSPAGVLLGRVADAAHRRELPLWIPNLGSGGLHLVLSFPGTLWVDGPAVPG